MKKHTFYRLTPLLLLILFLALINLAPRFWPPSNTNQPMTAVPPLPPPPLANTLATQTPAPVDPVSSPTRRPDPVPSPTPTLPPDAMIMLWGPPAASHFMVGDMITFYWTWPQPLDAAWHFRLYWLHEGDEGVWGSLNAPNVGQNVYRLAAAMPAGTSPGVFAWQVRLETMTGEILATSESRPITFSAASP